MDPTHEHGPDASETIRQCLTTSLILLEVPDSVDAFGASPKFATLCLLVSFPRTIPFEPKLLPEVLLLLRIYFPQITVTVTVSKFRFIYLITFTVTVLASAITP